MKKSHSLVSNGSSNRSMSINNNLNMNNSK
jgi:hypothetical protein